VQVLVLALQEQPARSHSPRTRNYGRTLQAWCGHASGSSGDPCSKTALLTAELGILERKGHVLHRKQHLLYVCAPVLSKEQAGASALRHFLETFFDGSTEKLLMPLFRESPREELKTFSAKSSDPNRRELLSKRGLFRCVLRHVACRMRFDRVVMLSVAQTRDAVEKLSLAQRSDRSRSSFRAVTV
jgi:hypothetical protein